MTTRETELLTANAALEAEVMRLRNALETFIAGHEECEDRDGWMAQMCSMEALHVADEAMSTPFTPQALHELIEKVEKRTIERCASFVDDSCTYGDTHILVKAVRALPNVTLEELL